jgi:putative pyruvate formate lyase activating enzyme
MTGSVSAYVHTWRGGRLEKVLAEASARSRRCDLCPHACGVDRLAGERGKCRAGRHARVASFGPHHGEEHPISGFRGSGTIFFAHCNLYCLFCQNWDISHLAEGAELGPAELAAAMLHLQALGCHNINLVSPSHVILPILEALLMAVGEGLHIPLVYNSGGYDAVDTIRLLDGVVDIYMPDLKTLDPERAARWTIASDYPAHAAEALQAMQECVGDLQLDSAGVAIRGLLVRHLMLPGSLEDTRAVLDFLATRISRQVYINLMSQYRPCHRAREDPTIEGPLRREDYRAAARHARSLGLERAEFQGLWLLDD